MIAVDETEGVVEVRDGLDGRGDGRCGRCGMDRGYRADNVTERLQRAGWSCVCLELDLGEFCGNTKTVERSILG